MIILFEVNETNFTTLGLGVLTDVLECSVNEKLNDEFYLQMQYPVNGKHYNKIQNNRILYCKPNPYDYAQAFRIYSITKPINGIITVNAVHISYDLNNIPINAISANNLQELLTKIQNESIISHNFKFNSDLTSAKTFKTTLPYNLRAILMGSADSIVSEYDAELKFNNFIVSILQKRGTSNGATVRYGHNMTDMNHEASTEVLFNGVFPFYHTETEKNETSINEEFTQAYIVGSKPLQDGWLSYSRDGQPYHPIDTSPIQIATDGDYYQKVYVWNDVYNIYQEKLYNQTVTVLQGILEPEWISIDWSGFPNIACKAAKKGYFKVATSNDWGDLKGVGDIVFEGSITNSGIMENMILYYSEVIPSNSESTNTEVSEIVDVQLDNKILWLETADAKSMMYDKILMLDLTSEFEEQPTQQRLQAKAEEYINKNKVGSIKHTTTISFLDLSATTEQSRYENFDHIEVGDTVKIIYEDAGISIELRVISAEYDVVSKRYSKIELGEKKDTMSSESVQNGDGVSSLTNDVSYATVTTVNKLIADVVTANYIEALNAKLTRAQISQLEVERINVTGIIEASQFTIDSLVAKLLVAENADIANVLTAGQIKVAGDITINSGQISIISDEGIAFIVDREGNVTANSVSITGGTFNINDGVFEVTNDGVLTAKDALIMGHIEAITGRIGGFDIINNQIYTGEFGTGIFLSTGFESETSIGGSTGSINWALVVANSFGVSTSGTVYANDIIITDGSINIGNDEFIVNSSGNVTIKSGSIDIGAGAFHVSTEGAVQASDLTITGGEIKIEHELVYTIVNPPLDSGTYRKYKYYYKIGQDYFLSTDEYVLERDYYTLTSGTYFSVNDDGDLETNSITITGGYLDINNGAFTVDNNGNITITSGSINIGDDAFIVDSDGNVTIEYGTVNIIDGSINLGQIGITDQYYFSVNNTGDVSIKSGSINLSDINGSVEITSDHILLGGETGTFLDNNGNIWVGYDDDPLYPSYNFMLSADGSISIGKSFSIASTGDINLFQGAMTLVKDNDTVVINISSLDITSIDSCNSALITNISSSSIENTGILKTSYEYISNYLYFNDEEKVSLRSEATISSASQSVTFTRYVPSANVSEANPNVTITVTVTANSATPSLPTKASTYISINISYTTYWVTFDEEGIPIYYRTTTGSRNVIVFIPSGTTAGSTCSTNVSFSLPVGANNMAIFGQNAQFVKSITYYISDSHTLEVKGLLIPSSYSNTPPNSAPPYTLGSESMPWNKLFLYNGYQIAKSSTYLTTDYINHSFASLIKYEPSLANSNPGSTFTIGVSGKTPTISSYGSYSDYSFLGLYSQGKIGLTAYGTASSTSGEIRLDAKGQIVLLADDQIALFSNTSSVSIQSNTNLSITSGSYISLTSFNNTRNLNRQGLFLNWSSLTSPATSLRSQSISLFNASEALDTVGPWELEVYYFSSIPANSSQSIELSSTARQAYGAMFQEIANGNGTINRATCRIIDYNGYIKNKITVYNNRALDTISGWLWVIFLRVR